MNNELQVFARATLKENLAKCTEGQQLIFKRMYSHLDLDREIDAVVDEMPEEKLDWAMQQVQRSVDTNESSDEKALPRHESIDHMAGSMTADILRARTEKDQ